jgi:hypothetical protein
MQGGLIGNCFCALNVLSALRVMGVQDTPILRPADTVRHGLALHTNGLPCRCLAREADEVVVECATQPEQEDQHQHQNGPRCKLQHSPQPGPPSAWRDLVRHILGRESVFLAPSRQFPINLGSSGAYTGFQPYVQGPTGRREAFGVRRIPALWARAAPWQ